MGTEGPSPKVDADGWTEADYAANVARLKAEGSPVYPCGYCGNDTTMPGQTYPASGFEAPPCCPRDACLDAQQAAEDAHHRKLRAERGS